MKKLKISISKRTYDRWRRLKEIRTLTDNEMLELFLQTEAKEAYPDCRFYCGLPAADKPARQEVQNSYEDDLPF
jgi:hypothetical protein